MVSENEWSVRDRKSLRWISLHVLSWPIYGELRRGKMFYDVQKIKNNTVPGIIFNDTKNGERNESEMIGTERVESSQ
jgi:hypothetical protein